MKFFFLLIVLANIFVAMWEYRYGQIFSRHQPASAEQTDADLEKIMLVGEVAPATPETTSAFDRKEVTASPSKTQEEQRPATSN